MQKLTLLNCKPVLLSFYLLETHNFISISKMIKTDDPTQIDQDLLDRLEESVVLYDGVVS